MLTNQARNECTSLNHIITFKKSRNITFKIIDLGMSPAFITAIPTDSNVLAWSNSKKPSAKSAKCSACANNAAMPSHKLMSPKRESSKRMIRRGREGGMARWPVRGRRLLGEVMIICVTVSKHSWLLGVCGAYSGSGRKGILAIRGCTL